MNNDKNSNVIDISNYSFIEGTHFNEVYMLKDEQEVEQHLDNIVAVTEYISDNPKALTVLTGSNGSGKSFVRKQVQAHLANKGIKIAHSSMQLRTSLNPSLGALSGFASDLDWIATSSHTLHLINNISNSNFNESYLLIDEPEIGMSKQMRKAIAQRILDIAQQRIENNQNGLMVITHDYDILKKLLLSNSDIPKIIFSNLNGLTYKQYMNNYFNPPKYDFDLDKFEEDTRIFKAIRKRLKQAREHKNK